MVAQLLVFSASELHGDGLLHTVLISMPTLLKCHP